MLEELYALTGGKLVGRILRDAKRDRLVFEYDQGWRSDVDAFPLSLSMPLSATSHGHKAVEAFIWGLLPDNDEVLRRWGKRYHVSPRNPFKLLLHVGRECAGQFNL